MRGRDATLDEKSLHGCWKVEQPQSVADRDAVAPEALAELLLCQIALVQQLLIRGSLFDRIQVLSMNVLDEGSLERSAIVRFYDHDRYLGQSGALCGTQTTLTHDQLVAIIPCGTHQQRLQHTQLSDGGSKLVDRPLVERDPGLPRVGGYGVQGDVAQGGTGRLVIGCLRWKQRIETATQASSALHEAAVHGCVRGHARSSPSGSGVATP